MPSFGDPPNENPLIEVVRGLEATQSNTIISELRKRDPSLAEAILEAMFTFEDLIYVTDRGIQTLIKEIDRAILVRALKSATEEVSQKFLSNLSQRASANLIEEIDLLPPTRLSEVKDAQRHIANTARKMKETGKIIVVRPGDEDPLV